MSNSDSPAGSTGGPATVPVLDELPEKRRVHALAKLIGRPSREVLAVLADGMVRYRGEAVVALVGERDVVRAIADGDVPIEWMPESPVVGIDAATAPGAPAAPPRSRASRPRAAGRHRRPRQGGQRLKLEPQTLKAISSSA